MKSIFSIFIALLSFSMASHNLGDKSTVLDELHAAKEYILQECLNSNQLESYALNVESNFSLQRVAKGKYNTYNFSKYSDKGRITANRCGRHLKSITLLHNSLPAITTLHHHILLLGILII